MTNELNYTQNTSLQICNECLSELSTYLFPSINKDKLLNKPYKKYTEDYCKTSMTLKYFKSYINPDPILKAKIYRSVFKCPSHLNKFRIFTSNKGIIIKYRDKIPLEAVDVYMDSISQSDNYVFVPPNYDSLNKYDYVYYKKLLINFSANENIDGCVLTMTETTSNFLFLCLNNPRNLDTIWKQYLNGGVIRQLSVPVNKIYKAMKLFEWNSRHKFRYSKKKKNSVRMMVKSLSVSEFNMKRKILKDYVPKKKYSLIDIGHKITDVNSAFGVCKLLDFECVPLVGTSKICTYHNNIEVNIKDDSVYPDEGVEIFSQEKFSDMTMLQKASLIKTEHDHWFYFLDLYQSPRKDPLNRVDFTKEFNTKMDKLTNVSNIFMRGFPPIKFDPELITVASSIENKLQPIPSISFYIRISKINGSMHFFWQIPNFKDTKYEELTNEAMRLLISKWSDKSIFRTTIPILNSSLIHLVFNPKILYMFEQCSIRNKENNYNIDYRAKHLQEQINILNSI